MTFTKWINAFDWEILNGKQLKISSASSVDDLYDEKTTVVIGTDVETGIIYVLCSETKKIQEGCNF